MTQDLNVPLNWFSYPTYCNPTPLSHIYPDNVEIEWMNWENQLSKFIKSKINNININSFESICIVIYGDIAYTQTLNKENLTLKLYSLKKGAFLPDPSFNQEKWEELGSSEQISEWSKIVDKISSIKQDLPWEGAIKYWTKERGEEINQSNGWCELLEDLFNITSLRAMKRNLTDTDLSFYVIQFGETAEEVINRTTNFLNTNKTVNKV